MLWQRVYDHLRGEILLGMLEPGAELPEVGIAEQLGVSYGLIREAIDRLASEGLVTVHPRRGAVVGSLSKEEFLQLHQVREVPQRGRRGRGRGSGHQGRARDPRRARLTLASERVWQRTQPLKQEGKWQQ